MKQRKIGLTLVEVLVALMFIGIAGGMFGYYISSLQTNRKATQQTASVAYAKDYLDGLRAKWQTLENYQNIALAVPVNPPENYDLEITIKNSEGETLYSYPENTMREDLSMLRTITLSFTDEQSKTVSLVTTLARPTPIPSEDE